MQLTNRGVKSWEYVAKAIGKTTTETRQLASKGLIPVDTAIQAIIDGMGEYDGMMDKMSNRTVSGLMSNLKDTFDIKIVSKWGKGLAEGATKGLGRFATWLGVIDRQLEKAGTSLYNLGKMASEKFFAVIEKGYNNLRRVMASDEFRNASLGGKMKLAWDAVIADPVAGWWESKGRDMGLKLAEGIGNGVGSFITGSLLILLGFNVEGATNDGMSIGAAFGKGIADGIDGDAIAKAIKDAFVNAFKSAADILPGGDSPTAGSWMSAAALTLVAKKFGLGKPIAWMGKKLFQGAGRSMQNANYSSWWRNVDLDNTVSRSSVMGGTASATGGLWSRLKALGSGLKTSFSSGTFKAWQKISSVSPGLANGLSKIGSAIAKVGGFFGKLGGGAFSKLGSFFSGLKTLATKLGGSKLGTFAKGNILSLLLAGVNIATSDDKLKTAFGQGGGLAGGAAGAKAGALLGSAIAPGAGTVVGGLVGGMAGFIGGEKAMSKAYDWLDDKGAIAKMKEGWAAVKEFGGKMKENFKASWASMKEGWEEAKTLGSNIKSGFEDAGKALRDFSFADMVDDFKAGWESAKTAFSDFFASIGDFFVGLPAKFSQLNEGIQSWYDSNIQPYVDSIREGVQGFFGEKIPGAFQEFYSSAEELLTETIPGAVDKFYAGYQRLFNEIIPAKAEEVWNSVSEFITEAIPQAGETIGNKILGFFTGTLPGKVDELKESAIAFVEEELPKVGQTLGEKILGLFNFSLPGFISSVWDETMGLLDESRGEAAGRIAGKFTAMLYGWIGFLDNVISTVSDFVSETIPQTSEDIAERCNNFFANTVPQWFSNLWSGIGDFVNETIPETAESLGEGAKTFFTSTVPQWFSNLWSGITDFGNSAAHEALENIAEKVNNFFTSTVPGFFKSLFGGAKSEADKSVESGKDEISKSANDTLGKIPGMIGGLFSAISSAVSNKIEEAKTRINSWWSGFKEGFNNWRGDTSDGPMNPGGRANGGFITRPELSWIGEAGPEVVIPLGGNKRGRGLDLWRRAGQALGVIPYADGGIAGAFTGAGMFARMNDMIMAQQQKKTNTGEYAQMAAGMANPILDRADDIHQIAQSSNALYRGNVLPGGGSVRDVISKAPTTLGIRRNLSRAAEGGIHTLYRADRAITAAKRVPGAGLILNAGVIAANTAFADEGERKKTLFSGLGELAGNVAGGAAAGGLLSTVSVNPVIIAGGAIAGGIGGAIGGEAFAEWIYDKVAATGFFSDKPFLTGGKIAKHATGGLFNGPHMGIVAEDGPEAIIPLGTKRRQRGISLWEQAGRMLGVKPYAEGGVVGQWREDQGSGGRGFSESVSLNGGGSVTVDVGGITIQVTGTGGSVLDEIRENSREIAEEVCAIIHTAMKAKHINTPLAGS